MLAFVFGDLANGKGHKEYSSSKSQNNAVSRFLLVQEHFRSSGMSKACLELMSGIAGSKVTEVFQDYFSKLTDKVVYFPVLHKKMGTGESHTCI